MSVPSLHAREHAGHIQLTEQLYRARSTHRSVPIRSDGVPDYRQVGYQKACPPLTTLPVPGSISGSARGHVLTSASGSYRSICAAGAIDQSQELSTQNNGHERQPQSPDWEYRPDEGQWRLGWQSKNQLLAGDPVASMNAVLAPGPPGAVPFANAIRTRQIAGN